VAFGGSGLSLEEEFSSILLLSASEILPDKRAGLSLEGEFSCILLSQCI
jgi:hypothetical protein